MYLLTGLQLGNRVTKCVCHFFFRCWKKVLPVTPLLSGVFVHRFLCVYFVRFEGVGVMCRFLWWTQENIELTCNGENLNNTVYRLWSSRMECQLGKQDSR